MKIYDVVFDRVINSYYVTAGVTYEFALEEFVPLINKLNFQRNPLRKSFYQRLEKDILGGCIMPNITLAIKIDEELSDESVITEEYIKKNIKNAFILDGIQRLNTMQRVSEQNGFPKEQKMYCNILICTSMDKLLYRMITLNNGQKPMTARHQIEILASNIFDFDTLPILSVTEKEKKSSKKNEEAMSKEVLIKGYLAYISGSVNIDNQKIIESKMNELIADQIMDSNIPQKEGEFKDVMEYINSAISNDYLRQWYRVPNNFIGFCAAMNKTYSVIRDAKLEELRESIELFEEAFSALDVSKIKLGMARRKLVQNFFEKYERLSEESLTKLIDYISMEI
mgnify:CR=1 FL=1